MAVGSKLIHANQSSLEELALNAVAIHYILEVDECFAKITRNFFAENSGNCAYIKEKVIYDSMQRPFVLFMHVAGLTHFSVALTSTGTVFLVFPITLAALFSY